jgi:DNA modification methylase
MRLEGGLRAAGSHLAVFRVALVEWVRKAYFDFCDLVFAPFRGSGTEIIAAERSGRRCCAVELDPAYCDVPARQWELATGRAANRNVIEEEARKPARRPRKRA